MNYKNDNIGATLVAKASGAATAVAGGAGDNTLVTGGSIDAKGFASAKIVNFITTSLASGKKLDVMLQYQTSENGSTWDSAVTLISDTIVTATGGAITAGNYTLEHDLNLTKRYIRLITRPNLDATETDTVAMGFGVVLGGSYVNPVTATI